MANDIYFTELRQLPLVLLVAIDLLDHLSDLAEGPLHANAHLVHLPIAPSSHVRLAVKRLIAIGNKLLLRTSLRALDPSVDL